MATISQCPSSWSCRRVRSRSAPDARGARRRSASVARGHRGAARARLGRDAERRDVATLRRGPFAPTATRSRRSSTGPTTSPTSPAAAASCSISGVTRASARAVADDYARELPQRRPRLGRSHRPRRARRHGLRGLDLERSGHAARHARPRRSRPVARRRGRRGAARVRPRDTRFLAGRLHLAEAHSGIAWLDRDSVLLMSALGPDMATRPGYARTVRLWRRGTDPLAAPVIFESGRDSVHVYAGVDRDADDRLWFVDKLGGIDHAAVDRRPQRAEARIDVPSDVWLTWRRGWLAVTPRTRGRSAARPTAPTPCWDLVRGVPGRRPPLRDAVRARAAARPAALLLLRRPAGAVDPRRPQAGVRGLTPASGAWSRQRIAGLPDLGTAYVWPFDEEPEETNGDLLAGAEDPLTPPTLYLIEPGKPPDQLKRAPAFDAAGLVDHAARGGVERRHAHPLHAGRSGRARDRRRAGASLRLRRLRHLDAALLQLGARQALARARTAPA